MKKIIHILKKPSLIFLTAGHRGLLNWVNDELYLKIAFKIRTGKSLNLKDPVLFNEKLQWLKLYDRKSIYSLMVDKYEAKKYVANIIGEKYIIPTIGVWDKVEDIDFKSLPRQFVLKCTHDSGGVIICKDKNKLSIEDTRKKLKQGLKYNFYGSLREWPYKNIKPRIIGEKFMQNKEDANLNVYKIFCFSGEPTIIQAIQNDKTDYETIDYFDTNWNVLNLRQNFPNSQKKLSKPKKLLEMLFLSRKLSKNLPFIRIDFYEVNGFVYFSEFTFYSDGGMENFYPEEWDKILGDKIILPKS